MNKRVEGERATTPAVTVASRIGEASYKMVLALPCLSCVASRDAVTTPEQPSQPTPGLQTTHTRQRCCAREDQPPSHFRS